MKFKTVLISDIHLGSPNDGTWQTDVPHFIGLHDHFISLYKYENAVITEELNIKY